MNGGPKTGELRRARTRAPQRLTDGAAETRDEVATAALLSRLPPSEPHDLAVERVWRRVIAPRAAQKRATLFPGFAWVGSAAVVALLLFAVLGGRVHRAAPAVELTIASGGVFPTKPAESWRLARSGEALAEAERVRTDATGRALLRVEGVTAVLVGEDSDVAFEQLSHGTFIRLSRGTLTAQVAKRKADEPFVVQTDRYSVKVVGTLFTVEQGPGDHTAVSVREGVVEVSDPQGQVARVVAGTRWASEARESRSGDHTPDVVKSLLEAGLAGRPAADLVGDFVAAGAPLAGAARSVVDDVPPPKQPDVAGTAPRSRPVPENVAPASVASTGAPSARTALGEPPVPIAQPVVSPAASATVEKLDASPAASAVTPELVAVPIQAAPSASAPGLPARGPATASDPYTRGLELEAQGDADGAARELAKAADEDPRRGDLALYSLGRLAERRLHDPRRALAAFRRYRTQYPRGVLLPEVDFEILRLEVDQREPAAALVESTRFLANHPDSERVDEVHLLRGNLLRDDGKCREALADYAAVRDAGRADDAVYSTAYCQRELGDRALAGATLAEYLRRFPRGAHRADAERAIQSGNEIEK
jgi:TolA-binding protein